MPFGIRRFGFQPYSPQRFHFFCGFKASRISHRIRFSYFAYQSPVEHLLYTALNRSALRLLPTMASADFSQFVVTMTFASPVRPRGISRQSFLVYLPDLRTWVTIAFGTSLPYASLSAMYALYQVSVRQATILLSLLLACTSRCKPWESLWGSSATTPLVDFHHRLTACPSYIKGPSAECAEGLFTVSNS